MKKSELQKELEELIVRVSKNCNEQGVWLAQEIEKASRRLLHWLAHLKASELTGVADPLLHGAIAAIREATACLCLGLVRPALNSLRLQIDLLLSWLYFKDHVREWNLVADTGNGFKLKTDLLKYFAEVYPRYPDRIGVLNDIKCRTQLDPYRLLSAHVHGQSEYVLHDVDAISDAVASVALQKQVVEIQAEISEYLSDILWALYAPSWPSMPQEMIDDLKNRFKTDVQRVKFFT
ncbi:hypothetical protein [Stenotrophomonas maltophilia]|uniref:hypothetical protein n=1 Tax=Stenotrophomonas maltophilia TaxID=40324 RepID=UPI0013D99EDC|nr:hypothetical protein [Stenotrophomonas maltophilia]